MAGRRAQAEADFRETRKQLRTASAAQFALPLALVEAELGSKKNWEDSDDLAMMFHGSYTSEFYRALRDALHLEVAAENRDEIEESWRRLELLRSRSVSAEPTVIGFGARG